MAGIAGIIVKKNRGNHERYSVALKSMVNKLSIEEDQQRKLHIEYPFYLSNVLPISQNRNNRFQQNNDLGITCVIDGMVFISKYEESVLSNKYSLKNIRSSYDLIPWLFDFYKKDIVHHITGWYNIVITDSRNDMAFLLNDRLGYLPLYYYDSDAFFVFASKIECLLITDLLPKIKFDTTTIAEHIFFNYPLSDQTYIRNIRTLSNAMQVKFANQKSSWDKYWNMNELFRFKPIRKKEGLSLINEGLHFAMNKIIGNRKEAVNVSFTGGWDSRVVLSSLLPDYKNLLFLYSFGAKDSYDINIPRSISKREKMQYLPFILDEDYLKHDFIQAAKQTIELSNGTRNYKRAHYLYAIQRISSKSEISISGIFGDEVFKISHASGGAVISQNTIDLIESDFDIDKTLIRFNDNLWLNYLNVDRKQLKDEFVTRLEELKNKISCYDSLSKKYYSIRFEFNLRKYFGNEVNSYNDYVYSFSPFIDHDFLTHLAQTPFFGIHYPFNTNSVWLKRQSTMLYHDLIKENFVPLIDYDSSRGYSMREATTMLGYIKILYRKYIKNKNRNYDGFNSKPSNQIFASLLENMPHPKNELLSRVTSAIKENNSASEINSLYYWMAVISGKFE